VKRRAIAAALLLAGCADPAQRTSDEALALQPSVTLPSVGGGTTAPSLRLRIVVSPTGISVDDAALFASWPAPRRARLLSSLAKDTRPPCPSSIAI
jgi:hypothetical protein